MLKGSIYKWHHHFSGGVSKKINEKMMKVGKSKKQDGSPIGYAKNDNSIQRLPNDCFTTH